LYYLKIKTLSKPPIASRKEAVLESFSTRIAAKVINKLINLS